MLRSHTLCTCLPVLVMEKSCRGTEQELVNLLSHLDSTSDWWLVKLGKLKRGTLVSTQSLFPKLWILEVPVQDFFPQGLKLRHFRISKFNVRASGVLLRMSVNF